MEEKPKLAIVGAGRGAREVIIAAHNIGFVPLVVPDKPVATEPLELPSYEFTNPKNHLPEIALDGKARRRERRKNKTKKHGKNRH